MSEYLLTARQLNQATGDWEYKGQRRYGSTEALNFIRKVIIHWRATAYETTADLMAIDCLNKCDKGQPQGLENQATGVRLIVQRAKEGGNDKEASQS